MISYISLRLSMIRELSKERLPIMLDESFAYYDEQRLQNMMEYLHKEFLDYQILIFTCTNREKQILEKQEIPYHLVQL
ncbi:MAG: ATP-binding protein [Clostridia bacterium]